MTVPASQTFVGTVQALPDVTRKLAAAVAVKDENTFRVGWVYTEVQQASIPACDVLQPVVYWLYALFSVIDGL